MTAKSPMTTKKTKKMQARIQRASLPDTDSPGTGAFYVLAAIPALGLTLFVLVFGLFGTTVTAGLDRACAEASFVVGKQMEELGNLEQAVMLYRQALDGRFENPERRLLCQRSLGEVLWQLRRPGEAVEAFDTVPAYGFDRAGTYTAFVNALLHEGELDRARDLGHEWLAAAEAESNAQLIVWAQFALGQTYDRLGQHENALTAYRAAAELEPGSSAAILVASTLRKLNRRDEALRYIDALLEDLPEGRARRDALSIRASLQN